MDATYLLMLYVTLDQENAIKELFHRMSWVFNKKEQASSNTPTKLVELNSGDTSDQDVNTYDFADYEEEDDNGGLRYCPYDLPKIEPHQLLHSSERPGVMSSTCLHHSEQLGVETNSVSNSSEQPRVDPHSILHGCEHPGVVSSSILCNSDQLGVDSDTILHSNQHCREDSHNILHNVPKAIETEVNIKVECDSNVFAEVADSGEPILGNGKPEVWNGEPVVQNNEPEVENDELVAQNGEPIAQNDEPEVWNGEPETGYGESIVHKRQSTILGVVVKSEVTVSDILVPSLKIGETNEQQSIVKPKSKTKQRYGRDRRTNNKKIGATKNTFTNDDMSKMDVKPTSSLSPSECLPRKKRVRFSSDQAVVNSGGLLDIVVGDEKQTRRCAKQKPIYNEDILVGLAPRRRKKKKAMLKKKKKKVETSKDAAGTQKADKPMFEGEEMKVSVSVKEVKKVALAEGECEICHRIFAKKRNYSLHIRTHKDRDEYDWSDAQEWYSVKSRPRKKKEIFYKHTCPVCKKGFEKPSYLERHMNVHVPRVYKACLCPICFVDCQSKQQVERHIKAKHEEPTLGCRYCKRKFRSQYKLDIHERSKHIDTVLLKCKFCAKTLSSKTALRKHEELHGQVKAEKRKDRPRHICEICGKIYKRKNGLNIHLMLHTELKSFKCNVCDKAFTHRRYLASHVMRHMGDRKYKCPHCDKAFVEGSALNRHVRIHTGEKPWSCDVCGKRFNQPGTVKIHMRMHTGTKPYSCDSCDQSFTQSNSLRHHKRSAHGIVEIPAKFLNPPASGSETKA